MIYVNISKLNGCSKSANKITINMAIFSIYFEFLHPQIPDLQIAHFQILFHPNKPHINGELSEDVEIPISKN